MSVTCNGMRTYCIPSRRAEPISRAARPPWGNDANPCTRTQPCQTFQTAHNNTAAGGNIIVLDPGGYGPVAITKSINIANDGVGTVGIRAASGADAITINAGSTDVVSLRGITIDGAGVGLIGIRANSVGSLDVHDCVVRGFTGYAGILFQPSGPAKLLVTNTLTSDNTNDGIQIAPIGGGPVVAILEKVQSVSNDQGIVVAGSHAPASTTINVVQERESAALDNALREQRDGLRRRDDERRAKAEADRQKLELEATAKAETSSANGTPPPEPNPSSCGSSVRPLWGRRWADPRIARAEQPDRGRRFRSRIIES
jgi:hypothetical protein